MLHLGRGWRRRGFGDGVGDQALVLGNILGEDDNRVTDSRVFAQGHLDFAELDAHAAELDLVVMRPMNSSRPSAICRTMSPVR